MLAGDRVLGTHVSDAGGVLPPPGQTQDVVVQRLDGFSARVRRRVDGSLVLEGLDGKPLPALAPGERLRVTRPVHGDATYGLPVRVIGEAADGSVGVKAGGAAQRDQQRDHVRVNTRPFAVRYIGEVGTDADGVLLDISAGGMRAEINRESVPVGTMLHAVFTLPDPKSADVGFSLDGEVVWSIDAKPGNRCVVGFQFHGADEVTKAKLMRWILRYQAIGTLRTRD